MTEKKAIIASWVKFDGTKIRPQGLINPFRERYEQPKQMDTALVLECPYIRKKIVIVTIDRNIIRGDFSWSFSSQYPVVDKNGNEVKFKLWNYTFHGVFGYEGLVIVNGVQIGTKGEAIHPIYDNYAGFFFYIYKNESNYRKLSRALGEEIEMNFN